MLPYLSTQKKRRYRDGKNYSQIIVNCPKYSGILQYLSHNNVDLQQQFYMLFKGHLTTVSGQDFVNIFVGFLWERKVKNTVYSWAADCFWVMHGLNLTSLTFNLTSSSLFVISRVFWHRTCWVFVFISRNLAKRPGNQPYSTLIQTGKCSKDKYL